MGLETRAWPDELFSRPYRESKSYWSEGTPGVRAFCKVKEPNAPLCVVTVTYINPILSEVRNEPFCQLDYWNDGKE